MLSSIHCSSLDALDQAICSYFLYQKFEIAYHIGKMSHPERANHLIQDVDACSNAATCL